MGLACLDMQGVHITCFGLEWHVLVCAVPIMYYEHINDILTSTSTSGQCLPWRIQFALYM